MSTLLELIFEAARQSRHASKSTCSAQGTTTTLIDAKLRDQGVDSGFMSGAWILRPDAADATDYVRRVSEDGFTVASGTLTPTRAWTNAPADGETYYLFTLAPPLDGEAGAAYSWQSAVNDALRRIFFVDRVPLAGAGGVYQVRRSETTLVAAIAVAGGSNATVTPPSGWTEIFNVDNGTALKVAAYRRRARPGDGATHAFTLDSSRAASGIIASVIDANLSTPVEAIATNTFLNLIDNGGFEVDTTGWSSPGGWSVAVSTDQAKFGARSLKIENGGSLTSQNMAAYALTLTAVRHTWSVWVYIPSAWDGGGVRINTENFTGVTEDDASNAAADMDLRDQWQQISYSFTPDAGDLSGRVQVQRTGVDPTVALPIYIDGAVVEEGAAVSESGSVSAPTVSTEADDALVLRLFAGDMVATFTPGDGLTERADVLSEDADATIALALADERLAESGAAGTGSATPSSGGNWLAASLALAPRDSDRQMEFGEARTDHNGSGADSLVLPAPSVLPSNLWRPSRRNISKVEIWHASGQWIDWSLYGRFWEVQENAPELSIRLYPNPGPGPVSLTAIRSYPPLSGLTDETDCKESVAWSGARVAMYRFLNGGDSSTGQYAQELAQAAEMFAAEYEEVRPEHAVVGL